MSDHKNTPPRLTEQQLRQQIASLPTLAPEEVAKLVRELELQRSELQLQNEALRRSEAWYRRFRESMRDAFVSVDMEGRIQEFNAAFSNMLGYAPDELLALRYSDITPDKWHSYEAELVEKQILPRGHSDIYEKEYRRKDGTLFPVELRVFLVKDDHDQPSAMWALVRDITDRKRAEESLRKAHDELEARVEARTAELTKANEELAVFRRFVEASSQGFGMATLDGTVTYVNPAISRLIVEGRPEDMVGHHISKYYSKEYTEQRETVVLPCILRDGHWEGETVIPHPHGSISVLQSSFLVRDERGNPAYLATVLTDITEHKQAVQALRQSHAELHSIYESVVDGIVIMDADTLRPLRVNAACCQMSGYSEEEVFQLSLDQVYLPQASAEILERLISVKKGNTERMTDVPFLRKDGSIAYVDVVSKPIRYNDRPCWISFIHNVTERKHAQEALEREHRTLRHLLQSSDHERQLIAYEIHDGLAQFLSGAIMQFETYQHLKEPNPQDAARAYEAGMMMLRQGHFEARRLISGVRPPILDEAGIVTAIAHLVNDARFRNGPEIEFHCDVAFDRLVPILENAIYRIVQEGLMNACRHSKSETVRVEVVQRDYDLHITIQDWGVGFDPNAVEGECFGLEGIRERARLLGGTMTVESQSSLGTSISVCLPSVLSP